MNNEETQSELLDKQPKQHLISPTCATCGRWGININDKVVCSNPFCREGDVAKRNKGD